jgi:hypothetical protein
LSVAPATPQPLWSTVEGRVALTFRRHVSPGALIVELEPGVREVLEAPSSNGNGEVHPASPWATSRIEFDGWDRGRAEAWVEARLGLRDLGRVARLDVPHRMTAELARAVASLLFPNEYRVDEASGRSSAIEFICAANRPVGTGNGRGKKNGSRSEGAGLELDLADRRHLDRLPGELRALLPNEGIVNYFEAQGVVRTLEKLAEQGAPALACSAVIALYRAQAELIRRLVANSPVLAASSIDIGTPADFQEGEYATVLVSLTRSHSHRAVPFGEGPHALATALTRARSRLLIFGDPGTLARRSEWTNALDHLDSAAAARERGIVARLLQYADSPVHAARAVPATSGAVV